MGNVCSGGKAGVEDAPHMADSAPVPNPAEDVDTEIGDVDSKVKIHSAFGPRYR